MIGIICAAEEEVSGIKNLIQNPSEETVGSASFTKGFLSGKECVLAFSGVGKVHAAACAQALILKYNPDFVINAGLAGGLDPDINVFDVLVADFVIQHDFDVSAFGDKKRGTISGLNISRIPCCERLKNEAAKAARKIEGVDVFSGAVLTGDQFINDEKKLKELREEFGGSACEMESGAVGQVCYINGVDFCAIKVISDKADESSHVDFKSSMQKCSEINTRLITNFISSI